MSRQIRRTNLEVGKNQPKITDFISRTYAAVVKHNVVINIIERRKAKNIAGIKFMQINNNKRYESMTKLNNITESCDMFIVLGQEPSAPNGKLNGLNSAHTQLVSNEPWPRAYIYGSRGLDLWPVTELSGRNIQSAILDTHKTAVNRTLVVSIY
jgi:hypothetical protein